MGNIKNVTHDIVSDGSGERTSGVGLQGCANNCDEEEYIVRRLTPTECARLQGFPDDWCADVPHTDAQEYKMWGKRHSAELHFTDDAKHRGGAVIIATARKRTELDGYGIEW